MEHPVFVLGALAATLLCVLVLVVRAGARRGVDEEQASVAPNGGRRPAVAVPEPPLLPAFDERTVRSLASLWRERRSGTLLVGRCPRRW